MVDNKSSLHRRMYFLEAKAPLEPGFYLPGLPRPLRLTGETAALFFLVQELKPRFNRVMLARERL